MRPLYAPVPTHEDLKAQNQIGMKESKVKQRPSGDGREMPLLTQRLLYCSRVFSQECVQVLLAE